MHKILFVCLGNICRSPMAESIFRHKVQQAGLGDHFQIGSAGTGDWHVGQLPDSRTIEVLKVNGITDVSRARQVIANDFVDFDHLIAMDLANVRDLHRWDRSVPDVVSLMSSWNPASTVLEIPDPYYGNEQDFHHVFALLDKGCEGLLNKLKNS